LVRVGQEARDRRANESCAASEEDLFPGDSHDCEDYRPAAARTWPGSSRAASRMP
jgi:hypothetical protein